MLRTSVESDAAQMAPAWIEIDLGAIAHNVRAWRLRLSPACRLIAVVKANAYGHGLIRVARAALAAGADELAVGAVDEGAALRAAGIQAPILLCGPTLPERAGAVVQHGLVPALATAELAAALARATRRFLPVQIEIDTGMARHGVAPGDLGHFVAAVLRRGRLSIAGVYTHLAGLSADDLPALRAQCRAFSAAVAGVPALRGARRHVCNSLGAALLPEAHGDAVRIGGGLLGFDPTAGRLGLDLRPVLALKARIAGLRTVPAGTPVGYGGTFVCQRLTRLALLPLGYADGLVRELWQGAEVLVRGRRAPLVGLISMNQATVDVTDLPPLVPGEEVVLLGRQGAEVAAAAARVKPGGSVYEVTALLSAALPRLAIGGAASPQRVGTAGR